jgi:hypothetical protein
LPACAPKWPGYFADQGLTERRVPAVYTVAPCRFWKMLDNNQKRRTWQASETVQMRNSTESMGGMNGGVSGGARE